MKITHLNFIHFFIDDKEFSLEALNTISVSYKYAKLDISLRVLNDSAINGLVSFFESNKEESILFLIGYNSKEEDPILTATVNYEAFNISKGICTLRFSNVEAE